MTTDSTTATTTTRRGALGLGLGAAAATATGGFRRARAQHPAEVKVAVLAPMSGPWARAGILARLGAEMAVDEINNAGGIRALGGAKVKLVIYDAGENAERAKNAAQRMVAQEPDLVGGEGAWLSSFTLAVTEVTERAELPWLTLSYADSITERGFRYVFQSSPTSSAQARQTLPTILELAERATGRRPRRLAMIADNTAAPQGIVKPIREGEAARYGLTIVVDETFTPPLSDATPLIQRVRSARPDFLLLLSTAVPDDKLLVEKLNEYGLGQGRLPTIGNGGHWGAPELAQVTNPQILEGMMFTLSNWPGKGHEDLNRRFVERTREPWLGHDSLLPYANIRILCEAMERSGSADRRKVAEAIRSLDLQNEGPALLFPSRRLKYDERGRLMHAEMVTCQWRGGVPQVVFPEAIATAQALWPRS
ncbi:ABC transporter substrate-binding protein [Caldovatus sediminis]|uniref:ABC transporter substrate-binding protein n=1 Tax=Caldovatus sediminis TaxID=2041189 RepID=A0A8J2Z9U5_9PROT|nr:ABC transporter substrate-binding protein [Caldovatus sediminis]GGG27469.1 ABC transporter substrate-binding protein [Caldovatus sediminis]